MSSSTRRKKTNTFPAYFVGKKNILNTRTFSVQSEEQILQGIHEDHSPRSFHWVTRSPVDHGLDRGGVYDFCWTVVLDGLKTHGFSIPQPPNQKEKHPLEFNELKKTLQATSVVSLGPQVGRWLLSLLFLSGVPCQKTNQELQIIPRFRKSKVVAVTSQQKTTGGATLKTGHFLCVRFTSGGCLQKTFVKTIHGNSKQNHITFDCTNGRR